MIPLIGVPIPRGVPPNCIQTRNPEQIQMVVYAYVCMCMHVCTYNYNPKFKEDSIFEDLGEVIGKGHQKH